MANVTDEQKNYIIRFYGVMTRQSLLLASLVLHESSFTR